MVSNEVLPTEPNVKFRMFAELPHDFLNPPNQNNVFPTAPNDKFKVIETAPIFAYSPTGSYSSASFKSAYVLKFKNPDTGSTVITSGIVGSNKNTVS